MLVRYFVPIAFLLVGTLAAPARAQVVATPYLHANFGDVEIRRGGLGLLAGYHGERLGFELDIDRHQHFFKDARLTHVIPNPCMPGAVGRCIDNDTDAWIGMANVVVPIPLAPSKTWRPYASVGAGVIHAWIHDAGPYDASQTNAASNLGGGVLYRVKDWLAIRADVRWFHAFVDENEQMGGYVADYDFARVSLGVTFSPF